MRDCVPREVPLRDPSAFRILVLGDSFTEGVGTAWKDTWTRRAEVALNDPLRSPPVRVLNGGVASYAPVLELVTLRELLARGLAVDLVVVAVDVSDPQDEVFYRTFLGERYEALIDGREAAFFSDAFVRLHGASAVFRRAAHKWSTWTAERRAAHLWRDGYYPDRNAWMQDEELQRRWGNEGVKLLRANLTRLVATARDAGSAVVLVTYPWPDPEHRGPVPSPVREAMHAVSREADVPLLDLHPAFEALEDFGAHFIPDDVHWNARGHALVGRSLATFLSDEGLVPPASKSASGARNRASEEQPTCGPGSS
jgi:lysophospholipase L1-like esterase